MTHFRLSKLSKGSSNVAEDDPVYLDLERGSYFPWWLRYLLIGMAVTSLLAAPAVGLFFYVDHPRFLPNGKGVEWPLKMAFVSSAALGTGSLLYYLVMALVAFVPFVAHWVERVKGHEVLSPMERLGMRQFVMLRSSVGTCIAMVGLSAVLVGFFGDVPPDLESSLHSWTLEHYLVRGSMGMIVVTTMLLIKEILVMQIAVHHHREFYADRIESSIFSMQCLKHLVKLQGPRRQVQEMDIKSTSSLSMYEDEEYEEMAAHIIDVLGRGVKDSLQVQDLEVCLEKEDAARFFAVLDRDGNGDLTRRELADGIKEIYADEDNLARSLAQSTDVISVLSMYCTGFALLASFFTVLAIFRTSFEGILATYGSIGAALLFVFGNTANTTFVAMVFIFVTHPFDVGDVVVVGGTLKLCVKEINLASTTFYGQGRRLAYVNNDSLCAAPIANLRRTSFQVETVTLMVSALTTREQLMRLEAKLNEFISQNSREYQGSIIIKDIRFNNSKCMTIGLDLAHKANFQAGPLKDKRTTRFMHFMRQSLKECGIELAVYPYTPVKK